MPQWLRQLLNRNLHLRIRFLRQEIAKTKVRFRTLRSEAAGDKGKVESLHHEEQHEIDLLTEDLQESRTELILRQARKLSIEEPPRPIDDPNSDEYFGGNEHWSRGHVQHGIWLNRDGREYMRKRIREEEAHKHATASGREGSVLALAVVVVLILIFPESRAYALHVLSAYKVLVVGTIGVWGLFALVPKILPPRWKGALETLSLLVLLLAPFQTWKEQRAELQAARDSLNRATVAVESLKVQKERAVREAQTKATTEIERKRARIIADLSYYVRQADTLASSGYMTSPEAETRWKARVRQTLKTSGLDETYLTEFDAAADSDDERTLSGSGSDALRKRKMVLLKFLDRLRSNP